MFKTVHNSKETNQIPETIFCKSSKKILRQTIYVMLAFLFISNIRFLFIDGEHYLSHLLSDLFYTLAVLIVWVIEDRFETDCVHYDNSGFQVNRGSRNSQTATYRFDDIVKINYMPYIGILTIKMKAENTYVDLVPSNYRFEAFEPFLEHLESYQPLSRGFYIPDDGIKTRAGKVVAFMVLIFFSGLILLGIYAQMFHS